MARSPSSSTRSTARSTRSAASRSSPCRWPSPKAPRWRRRLRVRPRLRLGRGVVGDAWGGRQARRRCARRPAAQGDDRAARARGDEDRLIAEHAQALTPNRRAAARDGLARAVALPPRRRARRRRSIVAAGEVGRHRRRPARRAGAGPHCRALRRAAALVRAARTSFSGRVLRAAGTPEACASVTRRRRSVRRSTIPPCDPGLLALVLGLLVAPVAGAPWESRRR